MEQRQQKERRGTNTRWNRKAAQAIQETGGQGYFPAETGAASRHHSRVGLWVGAALAHWV